MALLFFTVLIDLIGFGMIIPIMPFLAPKLGASNFDIALLIAIYSVFAGIVGSIWGKLSDKFGRKPIIITCLLFTAFSYVLLAMAHDLISLYIARIVAGCAAGVYGVAAAMVADLSTEQNRAKSMGLIGAAFGLGMVIGPFLGGVLAGDDIEFAIPATVAACMSVLAALFALFKLPESLSHEQRQEQHQMRSQSGRVSFWQLLKTTDNTRFIWLYLLHSMSITATSYLFPLWMGALLGWGPTQIGILFGIQGLCMAALQMKLVGMLVNVVGEMRVLLMGLTLVIGGYTLACVSSSEPFMILAFFCINTGATMCTPVLNSLLSKRTPAQYRGRMMGSASALGAWGRVFGPLIPGVLLSMSGYPLAWSCGIIIALLGIIWPVSQLLAAKQLEQHAKDPV